MRFRKLVAGAVAGTAALLMATTTSAVAVGTHTISDPRGDVTIKKGAHPPKAQLANVDLTKVTYGGANGEKFVRWQVRNLTKKALLPKLTLVEHRVHFRSYGLFFTRDRAGKFYGAVGYFDKGHYLNNKYWHVTCVNGATKGFGYRYNYRNDAIRIDFPKGCIPKGHRIKAPRAYAYGATMKSADRTKAGPDWRPNP